MFDKTVTFKDMAIINPQAQESEKQEKKESKPNPLMGVVFLVLAPILFFVMGGGQISNLGIGVCVGCVIASIGAFTGKLRLW